MKTCKRYNIPSQAHELTFNCYKRQLLLKSNRICNYLTNAITKAKEKHKFHIWAYVFMPEHVHLLVWPTIEVYSISNFLRSIKQSTSRNAVKCFRENNPKKLKLLETGKKYPPYHFWMPGGGYDRNITSTVALAKIVDYIHNNPVRRGLVEIAEDWKWSSANEWNNFGSGPIPVDRESFPGI